MDDGRMRSVPQRATNTNQTCVKVVLAGYRRPRVENFVTLQDLCHNSGRLQHQRKPFCNGMDRSRNLLEVLFCRKRFRNLREYRYTAWVKQTTS